MSEFRDFGTGATRDQNENKLNYAGFLSPLVIKRYAEYMMKHQKMADGSKRDADNWKQLFGKDHLKVCFESKMRHDMDMWLIEEGYPELSRDNIEDVCCSILFNTSAYLFKILKDKNETPKKPK